VLIEEEFKKALPCLSNCMVVGDRRKFLTILLTLKCKVDSEGKPCDALDGAALKQSSLIGSSATTVSEAMKCPEWNAYLQQGMSEANTKSTSRAQYINKYALLPTDFSIHGGELTPTLKVKRPVVLEKYTKYVEAMYN
jgi:long-chain-fatty-acid--CoA ligase ACSBG